MNRVNSHVAFAVVDDIREKAVDIEELLFSHEVRVEVRRIVNIRDVASPHASHLHGNIDQFYNAANRLVRHARDVIDYVITNERRLHDRSATDGRMASDERPYYSDVFELISRVSFPRTDSRIGREITGIARS